MPTFWWGVDVVGDWGRFSCLPITDEIVDAVCFRTRINATSAVDNPSVSANARINAQTKKSLSFPIEATGVFSPGVINHSVFFAATLRQSPEDRGSRLRISPPAAPRASGNCLDTKRRYLDTPEDQPNACKKNYVQIHTLDSCHLNSRSDSALGGAELKSILRESYSLPVELPTVERYPPPVL